MSRVLRHNRLSNSAFKALYPHTVRQTADLKEVYKTSLKRPGKQIIDPEVMVVKGKRHVSKHKI